jgi:tetratricopeptide (TPR) repeat protein
LLRADIRVREHIARSLFDQAQHSACLRCRSNAAFQASICLAIGFGIASNNDSAQEWLQRSGRSQVDFDQQLSRMSQWSQALEPYLYHTNFLNNLHNEGYLRNIDYFDVYTSGCSLDTIKQSYEKEVNDLAAKLGPDSVLSLSLNLVYALLLRSSGHYREASSIQENCLRYFQSNPAFGIGHLDTQGLMIELAETYQVQGDFEVASRYCEEVRVQRTKAFGHEHPLTLACLHLEAKLLQEMGSYEEAEKVYRALIPQRQSILGKYHGDTLRAMSDLGSLYIVQMRYDEALVLVDEELQLSEQLFGLNHYRTLMSLNNLAVVHFEKGDLSKAQNLLDVTIFRLRMTFGDNHPTTSTVLANCGSLHFQLGNHNQSISCYNEALLHMENLLGPDHPRSLEVVLAKAMLLVQLEGDFEEIDGLFQRCIQARERILGEHHPEVLVSLQEYSLFLLKRAKLDEAERSYRSLLLRQENPPGSGHVVLVETLSNLGDVLSQLGREDAEEMYRRAMILAKELDGGEEEISWACMRNLASYLHENGIHLDEAESLYQSIVDSKRVSSGEQPMEIYQNLNDLTEVLIDQGKFEEAEKTQRELIEISQPFLDIDNEDRLGQRATLAQILTKGRKFSEAEIIYLECIAISANTTGEDGERTLDLSASLAWNMEQEGKSQEARMRALGALQKSKERYGALHPVHLRVGAIVAAVHFRQGDHTTAIDLSREVVKGNYLVFGAESEEVQAAEANHAIYTRQV